jgi:heme A synthase
VAATETPSTAPGAPARTRSPLFSSVIGLTGVVVLLQAVWAGMFIREGSDFREKWVTVHSIGGTVAMVLSLVALIVAIVQLRSRRDLLTGTIVFFVLMVAEGLIGSLIGDTPAVETVHFPLALLLMGMTAWLSLRASRPA